MELQHRQNPESGSSPLADSTSPSRSAERRRPHSYPQADTQSANTLNDGRFRAYGWGPTVTLPFDCIDHAVSAQAARAPQAIAVEHAGDRIDYAQLERRATRVARQLQALGIGHGAHVGLFLRRSIEMVVGLHGILKSGAAYVPQDLRITPEPQLRHIIETAGIRVVLTLSELRHKVPAVPGLVCILLDAPEDAGTDTTNGLPATTIASSAPDATCFLLFTSGTTGLPNGVQVTHRNVCNIVLTAPGHLGIAPGMRVGQILNIAFDMAAWEILGALAHGATLVIRGEDIAETAAQVDVLIATPSILSRLDPERCPHIQAIALAGEPCPQPLADRWAGRCRFHNGCGPTETTIVNTLQHYVPGMSRLSIGRPTPNNTVYVLDEHLQPCAIGEVGEMWAGGDCVTAGYLGNDTLTAERYRPDPFLGGGRKMFRTRDLGRWTPEGELEHLGRVDDQVKIRGYRVELDAISHMLERAPGCLRAATLKYDARTLVAFVSPETVDIDAAREGVAAALPYYCMPERIIALAQLPLTDRGKIDKRLLLQMAQDANTVVSCGTPDTADVSP